MKLVTFASGPTGAPRLGVRVGHRVLDVESASRVDGEPLPSSMKGLLREGRGALSRVQALAKAAQVTAGRYSSAMHEERAIRFLPPVPDPGKFRVGNNARAAGKATDFVKLSASLVGHNAKVVKPAAVARLDCQPGLVFVIGRRALRVTQDDDETDYVVGVTILNDLIDGEMLEGELASGSRDSPSRNAPGFGPLGPEIVTLDEIGDPDDLWMTCTVNGQERLRASTRELIWKMSDFLEHFSRDEPLEPGDMFSSRATGGVAAGKPDAQALCLEHGDVVECSIEGITTLRTTIIAPQ